MKKETGTEIGRNDTEPVSVPQITFCQVCLNGLIWHIVLHMLRGASPKV